MVTFLNEENLKFENLDNSTSSDKKYQNQKIKKKGQFDALQKRNINSKQSNTNSHCTIQNDSSNSSDKNITSVKSFENDEIIEKRINNINKSGDNKFDNTPNLKVEKYDLNKMEDKSSNNEQNKNERNESFNLIDDNQNVNVNASSSIGGSDVQKKTLALNSILNKDINNYKNEFNIIIDDKPKFTNKIEENIHNKYEEKKRFIGINEKFIELNYFKFRYDEKNKDSIVEISSIDEFCQIYSDQNIISNISSLKEKYNLHGIRGIRGDGNCLYRSFLFLFFERLFKLIIEGENIGIIFLKKLTFDIFCVDVNTENYYYFEQHFANRLEIQIENAKEVCLSVLKLIIELNEDNHIKKEDLYKFFLINYAKNHQFENFLICWLRSKIKSYLEGKSQECESNNDLPLLFCIDNINHEMDTEVQFRDYLKKNILKYGEEGETIITVIFPFLFGVNGQVINITKLNDKIHLHESKNIANRNFKYDSEEEKYLCNELIKRNITITIFHRENHFDVLYDREMYDWVKKIEQTLPKFQFKYQLNKTFL